MKARWKPTTVVDKKARKPGRAGDSGRLFGPTKGSKDSSTKQATGQIFTSLCDSEKIKKNPWRLEGEKKLFLKLKLSPGSLSPAPSLSPF